MLYKFARFAKTNSNGLRFYCASNIAYILSTKDSTIQTCIHISSSYQEIISPAMSQVGKQTLDASESERVSEVIGQEIMQISRS